MTLAFTDGTGWPIFLMEDSSVGFIAKQKNKKKKEPFLSSI